ncbi:MAG: fibronectin type III domain-containing protein, partial [Sciscionella sp.]
IPAIALVALAVGVIYAINVFQDNALPGQLATLVTEAPTTTPDVYAMLGTPAQSSGAYGLFVGATLPDPLAHSCDNSFLVQSATNPNPAPCLNGPPLPVQNASDPTFLVSEKGVSGATAAPTINWQDSSAGTTNSAWLAGNWFVNTETAKSDGSTLTLPRLEIHYTDWNGDEQTAWLVGDAGAGYQFVTFDDTTAGADSSADVLAPSTCATKGICDSAPSIQYLGTDGKDHAATVVAGSAPVDPTPTVSVTTSATKVTVSGSPLTYTAHASSPAGLPLHYSWCVMHGSTNCDFAGTDPTLTFTPTFAGPLYAYLTVTDSQQHYAVASDVSLSVVDPSSTSLQVSPSSPAAGAPVTLTATVSDQAATNKFSYGYVDFFSGGALVCSNVRLTPTVPPGPNTATCTTTFQAAGPHPVLAYYAGGYLGGGQLILASSATATVDVAGPPSAPAGLVSSAGNGQVHLSWSAPADNGSPITGYRVYQGTDTGGESAIPAATVDGTTTSAVVSGLTNGTRYYFTVEAVNANGSSLPSSEATATPATVPDVPTGLLATAGQPGSGKLTLSWTAPANDGGSPLLGYQVFQAASPGAEATTPVAALTGTSTTITGLSDYTAYYFTVKAINAVGTGAVSGEASTTLGVPPSVTTTSLPAATVGTPYNATLSAT